MKPDVSEDVHARDRVGGPSEGDGGAARWLVADITVGAPGTPAHRMPEHAEPQRGSESAAGVPDPAGSTGTRPEGEAPFGAPSRYIDDATQMLGALAATWQDFQQTRKAMAQRGLGERLVESFTKVEEQVAAALTKELRGHELWPWLAQYPGLGGVHTARLIARIGDPRRFPGQRCSIGHHLPPGRAIASPCPITDREGDGCPGVMEAPRSTTGTRALWHFTGLHVDDDGRLPMRRKGVRATWDPLARTSILQPGGIAEQIVRLRVPVYRDIYDAAKARLAAERGGVESEPATETSTGPADVLDGSDVEAGGVGYAIATESTCGPADVPGASVPDHGGAERWAGSDHDDGPDAGTEGVADGDASGRPSGPLHADHISQAGSERPLADDHPMGARLTPIQVEKRARIIAAKAFVADLLTAWKRTVAERRVEIAGAPGDGPLSTEPGS